MEKLYGELIMCIVLPEKLNWSRFKAETQGDHLFSLPLIISKLPIIFMLVFISPTYFLQI